MSHFGQIVQRLLEVSGKAVAHLGGKEFVHPALNPSGRASSGLRPTMEHGFKIVKGNFRADLHRLVRGYLTKRTPLNKAKREAEAIIIKYYEKAFVYGMRWQAAGKRTPKSLELSAEQRRWVVQAARDEYSFFARLLDDVRYKRVFRPERQNWEDRIRAYAHALDSVRDAGRVAATPDDMVYFWFMDREAEHCDGCAYLEEQSPFTKHNLPCLGGDTVVRTLAGDYSIRDLWEGKYPYKDLHVWAFDQLVGGPSPARAAAVVKKPVVGMVRVILDDGNTVECTRDHRFLCLDGQYMAAGDLAGHSLRRIDFGEDADGYLLVMGANGRMLRTHWLVARSFLLGGYRPPPGERVVVHHCNFKKQDNDPANLMPMGHREHSSYHMRRADALRHLRQDPEYLKKKLAAASSATFRRLWAEDEVIKNHRVVRVEECQTGEVFDIVVPGYENFALAAGIYAHNCTPRDGSTRCLSFCKCRLVAKRVTPQEYKVVAAKTLSKSRLVTHLRALFPKRKIRRS